MKYETIGIIGALDAEVELLTEAIGNPEPETISGISFWCGQLDGHTVVVGLCGCGKINAAVCAQIMLMKYNVDAVINSGIAGGLHPELHQCDVVVSTGLVQHDTSSIMNEHPDGWVYGLDRVVVEADPALCSLLYSISCENSKNKTLKGIIATGDQFISDSEKSKELYAKFNAFACDMEGGAIAQVCAMAGVPFAAVRTISDSADDSPVNTFWEFRIIAAHLGAELMISAISRL